MPGAVGERADAGRAYSRGIYIVREIWEEEERILLGKEESLWVASVCEGHVKGGLDVEGTEDQNVGQGTLQAWIRLRRWARWDHGSGPLPKDQ